MRYLLTLFSFVLISNIWSQINVHGKILDSAAVKPISGAIIIASKMKDSLIVQFTRTNRNGEFQLSNLPIDTFKITVGHPKFEDQQLFIFGNKEDKNITLPTLKLDHIAKELKEIVIYANKSPIYYTGDTLVFVADSFKVRENAVAEDLLRKLPGVSVDARGKVTFQGRDIDQIYVDGDEFFGNDPTVATKNLGAKGIQHVQIYEKKNNTENGEESKQIMNLTLKEDAKKGFFGKIALASDGNKFYEGEVLYNRYQNKKNYSFYLLKNNTPRLGFNWQDQNKYGLNNDLNSTSNGFPENFTTGARFKNSYGKNKKHFFEINYQFRDLKSRNISTNNTQFLVADTSYYNNSEQNNFTRQQNHTLTIENKWKLDSLTTLELIPEIKYSIQNSDKKSTSSFINNKLNPFRNTSNNVTDTTIEVNIKNTLKLERKYMKPKRESSISSDLTYSDNQDNGTINFFNQISSILKQTNQLNDINQKTLNQTLTLFHTE
ncbi:MAG: carboxypeptidase regulatory-like domain-containing protein, partial [Crocinitomicaceae bacterium]